MTTPAPGPGLSRAVPSAAINGTAMPVDVEQEVRFADGTWDLVIVCCQAAGRCGGPAGRSFWRWQDWGVGEGSGTGRPTIFGGSVWMGGAAVGQDSAPVSGRGDRRWQWLNPAACPSARSR
jgi:hypothetical protein